MRQKVSGAVFEKIHREKKGIANDGDPFLGFGWRLISVADGCKFEAGTLFLFEYDSFVKFA